jgi:hypothetical protein
VCGTQHHHVHHGHWINAGMGMESPLPLMDLDDETKMLEGIEMPSLFISKK